ncbi:MAG: polysaccharide deacetylase family protein [Saprospiraceae bacterium]
MIKVFIPDNFIPERSYIVRTLLQHYCGAEIEIIPKKNGREYELVWGDKSIIVQDHFFGNISKGETYLQSKYIPEKIIPTQSLGLDHILLLYGDEHLEITRDKIVCHVDLFAGAFFMLTRWEEAVIKDKDSHGRFPADKALVVKSGQILRPVVDEYTTLLRYWLLTLGYPLKGDTSEYKVVPTCDVDKPYYWKGKPGWKVLAGGFRRNPFQFLKDMKQSKAVKRGQQKDPYDQFDYMMTLAERSDNRFEFNMIGGGRTRYEGHYDIGDEQIKTLMQEMSNRVHRIGAHPSYASFKDASMIKKEIEAISKSSGLVISSSRQHYLRFEVPDTWRCLSEAGIKTDSTLGFAAEPGFRCGTSKPFSVFDIHERKELPLIERPLLIMDVSFRMYKKYTIEQSIDLSQKIIEQVKKHNGELVILWHNSSLSEIDGWAGWDRVLEYLLAVH